MEDEAMEPTHQVAAPTVHFNHPQVRRAFRQTKTLLAAYGALSTAVLIVVAILALTEKQTTPFMWVRSVGVLASAGLAFLLVARASRGAHRAYQRLRFISIGIPSLSIAIDLIPGMCPLWFAAMQAVGALSIAGAAIILNGSQLRSVFFKLH
ncbi:hypothetical protein ACIQJT_35295 [Streptomyces sp. NPDC091972]|uniref:hypothetical protein n=1 Tax=Streptomyces sp. NPDC091972 TaxID=3366007 RepID=UPI00382EDE37